ncbi:hypothetical protein BDV96DRAFT_607743 [Lophiotrema nucula]|uniref:Uncharacterized protein n=1 Tax=Lophiotrema nucula TaxID=690887 RepID=A0A6A5YGW9_9PLEO|nr:hypothetical protein BDV96DRAFT_607743 [Lophiotrema nucula]
MCFIRHTRYFCGHISPIHTATYDRRTLTRPTNLRSWQDWSPEMSEMPSHPDTDVMPDQDCLRRGTRCPGLLEKLPDYGDVVVERVCEECAKLEQASDKARKGFEVELEREDEQEMERAMREEMAVLEDLEKEIDKKDFLKTAGKEAQDGERKNF